MAESFYSPSWHRVAKLKPRLMAHVRLHRHSYRGRIWHVVQDNQTGQFFRLSAGAYRACTLMDGERTIEDIWEMTLRSPGADQPTQNDIVRLLTQLYNADLLHGGTSPYLEEQTHRADKRARQQLLNRIRNPLAMRVRLVDPDRFLNATMPFVRPFFSIWGVMAWLALVIAGAVLAGLHWRELQSVGFEQIYSTQNVLVILAIYPITKLLHELGHAYAVKNWGGEVHEMGLLMLVLMPVPYCDASSSIAFREKHRRAVVGAAGMVVELALAAIAMIIWSTAEAGVVRAIAFNVALICGVSTLIFNGNPLLKFDGYYILSDLIEIPNLAQQANAYFFYLIKRFGFGMVTEASPRQSEGERRWLVSYSVASFFYRISVSLTVALLIAHKLFFIGVMLALFSVFMAVVWPLFKGVRYLATSPALEGNRRRALRVSGLATLLALAALLVLPLPYSTVATGIVWIGEDGYTLRSGGDGYVKSAIFEGNRPVKSGETLFQQEDDQLTIGLDIFKSAVDELKIKREAVDTTDRSTANIISEQIRLGEERVAEMKRRLSDLTITAPVDGTFISVTAPDAIGRFQKKGDVVGYLAGSTGRIVRVVVPEGEIDLVANQSRDVEVMLTMGEEQVFAASVLRQAPAALDALPHGALSTEGGGSVLINKTSDQRLVPLEPVFQLDLKVAGLPEEAGLGMHARVRFIHPAEPIAPRLYRQVRQLFLRQFNV